MVEEWSLPGWAVVAAAAALLVLLVLLLVVGVAGARARARARADLAAARAEATALHERLDALERRVAAPVPATRAEEFVITRAGEPEPTPVEPVGAVPAPLFADLVLRESVVQAASLAAGVRRALSPEVRNRIRFEVKREVRRSRKQRRADLRAARRDWEARRRGALDEGSAA
ncbi:hypothetical protein G6553_02700 [Nocardioides sp. IC4_145]|uniref:hypothetical protein n=1 Tax=Nocardioides sp. IC4_145 TaxID=2714037 RepID=UPI00140DD4DC|nr:hypothetical protein [Nocardioides sp. IC4_145]NHC22083.1 hypothetical protein [Nocardioides sp. IC4_145]